jgi:hypothetical protein
MCGCVYFIHVWYIRKLCLTKLVNLTIYSHTYPNSHLELLLPGVDGQFKTLPTGFMLILAHINVTVENEKQCNLCTSIFGRLLHIQIPPSVSTIKHSGRTESFVGLHTDKCPTKLSDNCPTKSSQVGVRVSTLR